MPSMLDCPLVLQVKLSVVYRIEAQSNKFVIGMKNEGTGVSKLNDSPVHYVFHDQYYFNITQGIKKSAV